MAEGKRSKKAADDEAAVTAKIASFDEPYRTIGRRVHEVILESVPELRAKLWYGMPGYVKGGPVLCFFRVDDGVMSFGVTEKADISVEEGAPDQLVGAAWFVSSLDTATEERIAAIVRRATG